MLDDAQFLRLIADECRLLYLVGRTADGYLNHHGVVEHGLRQLLNLVGHGGGKHDGLTVLRQLGGYLKNVVGESHVEHAVCLVKYEEADTAQIDITYLDVAEQTAWGGNDHVGSHAERTLFLVIASTVVAAIDGHATHRVQIVAKTLHGLVYLLGELTCGSHDETVDGIGRIATVVEHGEDGQQVGGCLAGSCLCHPHHVVLVENLRDALLLNGSHLLEMHVVECIEYVVIEIGFFESHLNIFTI